MKIRPTIGLGSNGTVDQCGLKSSQESCQRIAFIVKGPPTYLTAEEAQHQGEFEPQQCILFVVIPALEAFNRTERIQAVIDPSRWAEVCWVRIASKSKYQTDSHGDVKEVTRGFQARLYGHKADALKAKELARQWGSFDTIYGIDGAFYEHLAYQLKPKKLILLEAGISMLSRIGKSGYINYWERAGKADRLILLLNSFKIIDRSRTSLFTNYEEIANTKHPTIANTNSLKTLLCSRQPRGSHVLWIGAPFCEYFGVSEDRYTAYIAETLKKLGIQGQDVIYIAHPGKEDTDRLKRLSNTLSCTVDTGYLPAEVKVAKGKCLPRTVLSAFSSSLANLAKMLPGDISIISAWHQQFNAIGNLLQWRSSLNASTACRIEFQTVGENGPLFDFRVAAFNNEVLYNSLTEYAKESGAGMFKAKKHDAEA